MHSWRVLILPWLDEQALYAQYDFNEPWNGPRNSLLLAQRPDVFQLHGARNTTCLDTNYLAVSGPQTVWSMTSDPDFLPDRIMVVENVGSGIEWMEPRDLNFETMALTLADNPADGISSWLQPPAVVTANGRTISLDVNLSEEELREMVTIGMSQAKEGIHDLPDGRHRAVNPDVPRP